jgi:fucose 4-O-acetylase-like acetyltransferase
MSQLNRSNAQALSLDETARPRAGRQRGGDAKEQQGRGRSAPQPRQRDAFFDNAKYLAIVLVAMGHFWEPLRSGSRAVLGLYLFVYAFHMPVFILISGYFSRNFDLRADRLKRLITGLAVPYLVFETCYPLFKRIFWGDPVPVSLTSPWFLTWFLCALFIWRLTAPLWRLVRWPLPLALVIGMLATTSPAVRNDVLDLQRVLQLLPFFVLGMYLKPEHFEKVRTKAARIVSVPVILAAIAVGYWAADHMNPGWFFHRASAQEMGVPWWVGPIMFLAVFGCSVVLCGCFLAWVPSRRTWFTALGANTLYGYLLHGFVVKTAEYNGWYDTYGWLHTPLGEVTVTVFAAVVMTLLCTPPVRKVFRGVLEPQMNWAFKFRDRLGASAR